MPTDILHNPDDQAAALRAAAAASERMPTLPAVAITGGKGGVGKTCLAVNLSVMLARLGRETLLVDGDLGLANADALLGVHQPSPSPKWCWINSRWPKRSSRHRITLISYPPPAASIN